MITNEQIKEQLFSMQDLEYKAFHEKLIPNVDPDCVIGVRTPTLRAYAKQLNKAEGISEFLNTLPHHYYEENNLHAFLIEQIKDYKECVHEVNRFLPYVDNWATCDMMRPKCLKKHTEELRLEIKKWIRSKDCYTIRFGIEMLMVYYLDEEFREEYLEMVAEIESEEYYVNMMIAWYFATALAKQYESTVPYLEKERLSIWVHNKTIQKAVESNRITAEQKKFLRALKKARSGN